MACIRLAACTLLGALSHEAKAAMLALLEDVLDKAGAIISLVLP